MNELIGNKYPPLDPYSFLIYSGMQASAAFLNSETLGGKTMNNIAKINDEAISEEDFIKLLKLNGSFAGLLEEVVKNKLLVLAAKKAGISVSTEEVQKRADQLRRARRLHRAKDMMEFLKAMRVTLDEFEESIRDTLYREKMMDEITQQSAVEEFFKLNSPQFDRIEISHIVVDSEGKAKEIMALVSEEPDSFAEMAKANSIADTAANGGVVGRVLRGLLPSEVESKVFNAAVGEILGPFQFGDGARYEIFKIDKKSPAQLDDEIRREVQLILFNNWLKAQAQENKIELS